jgi:hypothetical protein
MLNVRERTGVVASCPLGVDGDGLADLYVAGAGLGFDGGAAAVDSSDYVVTVEVALHGEGLLDVDGAGAGVGVEGEFGGCADVDVYAAGAGVELPVLRGLAVDFDISRAGAGVETAVEAADADGAGAGLGADVAGGGLLEFDVAGAGLEVGGAVDAAGTDGAGAGVGLEISAYVLDFYVAGAGGRGDGGVAGQVDVVVDGDVAEEISGVALADGDVVAALGDGWVADDLLDSGVDVVAAAHPAVVAVNVAGDVDLIVGAGVEADAAGAGGDGDVGGAVDGEVAVEVAVFGEGNGGRKSEGGGDNNAGIHRGSLKGELLLEDDGVA